MSRLSLVLFLLFLEFLVAVVRLVITISLTTLLASVVGLVGGWAGYTFLSQFSSEESELLQIDEAAGSPEEEDVELGYGLIGANVDPDFDDPRLDFFAVAFWTFALTWVVTSLGVLAGRGWLVSGIAGAGVAFVTSVVTTVSVYRGWYPHPLFAVLFSRTIGPLFYTLPAVVLLAGLFGLEWWYIREGMMYGLDGARQQLVAPEASAFAFYITLPYLAVSVVLLGSHYSMGVLILAIRDRFVDAVAVVEEEHERTKVAVSLGEAQGYVFGYLYTLILFGLLAGFVDGSGVVIGNELDFIPFLIEYRRLLAGGFEVFTIGATVWGCFLMDVAGASEKTVKKVVKRLAADFVVAFVIVGGVLLVAFPAAEVAYSWAFSYSTQVLGGGPQSFFSPEALELLSDGPLTPSLAIELFAPKDPTAPTELWYSILRFAAPFGIAVPATLVVTTYLYFAGLRSILANLGVYFGFSTIEAAVKYAWTGELGNLAAIGRRSLVPTVVAILVVGLVHWYVQQLGTRSCPACYELVPARSQFCPECGADLRER